MTLDNLSSLPAWFIDFQLCWSPTQPILYPTCCGFIYFFCGFPRVVLISIYGFPMKETQDTRAPTPLQVCSGVNCKQRNSLMASSRMLWVFNAFLRLLGWRTSCTPSDGTLRWLLALKYSGSLIYFTGGLNESITSPRCFYLQDVLQ